MKLLANENFPLKSIYFLRDEGFDIRSIGLDFFGITDQEVIDIAIKESRTILTFDRDYGELIFKNKVRPPKGVIYLRLKEFYAEEPGRIVSELIEKKTFDFDFALTVVEKNLIRQRKY